MAKLRVLQVIPNLAKGGAERLVIDICNELAHRGIYVTLLTFHPELEYSHLSSSVTHKVIEARYVPSVFGAPDKYLEQYIKIVNEIKPDIIHTHLFEAEIATRQYITKGTKYVSHFHDNMKQFRKFHWSAVLNKSRITDLVERNIMIKQYRRCKNNFVAISKDTVENVKKNLPADLHRIYLLHNAIDLERFFNPEKKLISNPVKLITTGSLVDKKNQTFLIDVIQVLNDRGIDIHLDILGDGPNRMELEVKVIALGLEDRITFHGNVDRVENFLKGADIYIHGATYEPFGLALIEAMASGLPCVALDGKGNRDIIKNGENGFLLEKREIAIFASTVERLIKEDLLYSAVSEHARQFAKGYDIKSYVDKLLSYYKRCQHAP